MLPVLSYCVETFIVGTYSSAYSSNINTYLYVSLLWWYFSPYFISFYEVVERISPICILSSKIPNSIMMVLDVEIPLAFFGVCELVLSTFADKIVCITCFLTHALALHDVIGRTKPQHLRISLLPLCLFVSRLLLSLASVSLVDFSIESFTSYYRIIHVNPDY